MVQLWTDLTERLEHLLTWVRSHLAEQEVSDKISEDVREGLEKTQRDFLLRQQLAAIRKELGEDEPDGAEDYRARVEKAEVRGCGDTFAQKRVVG